MTTIAKQMRLAVIEYNREHLELYVSGIVAGESHQFDAFGQPNDDYSKQDTDWWRLAGGGSIHISPQVNLF